MKVEQAKQITSKVIEQLSQAPRSGPQREIEGIPRGNSAVPSLFAS